MSAHSQASGSVCLMCQSHARACVCLIHCPLVRDQGVIAYSIGIAWAAQDELEFIATDPDKEHSFFVDEFDNLYKFVPKIIHNICQEFNSQPRN